MTRPGGHPDRVAARSDRNPSQPEGLPYVARSPVGSSSGPEWLKEPGVRITRKGPRKMSKHNIVCAGIDTGKNKLDVAITRSDKATGFANDPHGHAGLVAWLRRHHIERVGIEASGGYERAVVAALRRNGVVVIVFQPIQ